MIEGNPDQKIQSKRNCYALEAFRVKNSSLAQLKISVYSKEFLANYLVFLEFACILKEVS